MSNRENNRQRWIFGTNFLFLTLIWCAIFSNTSAEGNIGCLFAEGLCLRNVEECIDDYAFGKCVSKYDANNEELMQPMLDAEQARFLAEMLEELENAGMDWKHQYVQCRLQGALFSIRQRIPMPSNLCANFAPPPSYDNEVELDPELLGSVRLQPHHERITEEIYATPWKKNKMYKHQYETIQPPQHQTSEYLNDILNILSAPDEDDSDNEVIEYPRYPENLIGVPDSTDDLKNRMNDIKNRMELRRMLAEYEYEHRNHPQQRRPIDDEPNSYGIVELTADEGDMVQPYLEQYEKRYPAYNHQQNANENQETENISPLLDKLMSQHTDEIPHTSFREVAREYYIPTVHYQPDNTATVYDELENELLTRSNKMTREENFNNGPHGIYTEGGLVVVPDEETTPDEVDKDEATVLADLMGFTRHERLDVKKPGPSIKHVPDDKSETDAHQMETNKEHSMKEVLPAHITDKESPKTKKLHIPYPYHQPHELDFIGIHSIDTDYVHVVFNNPLMDWSKVSKIVSKLSDMFQLNFTHKSTEPHEVIFLVEKNPANKSAFYVADRINKDPKYRNTIQKIFGETIRAAGVGNKARDYTGFGDETMYMEYADAGPNVTHVMIYMFAGAGVAAVIVIIVTLLLIKRHDRRRDKLGGLQAGLSRNDSSSKDYQDLCRARMAGKGNGNETPSGGRIVSLSKETERPPSSRSSTSSWSEEPALTNMDISTGHMVLSYMEDHLKNKGRLQREWEALVRYEAEPSAKEAALQAECATFNRSGAPLPYDHSRVVLNHLANADDLDYINASTITDHDPRAPAYVAAQGPLNTTKAHFWQMVWEQGAVVIVALCRLQENGDSSCARYWPEEGSEVFHIYEVNLVSEHIWCDDYLVRSFYLKNLRTGETRTVTQFHFLSWPINGVPISVKALLEFRRKVNKSYRGRSCPIVVHSSHGAGRAGAYILLDLVLARMNKGAREIDIAATLEHLRDQRAGLVGTRQQFEFVLMAVAEEVHAILKALPANSQNEKRNDMEKENGKEQESSEKQNGDEDTKKQEKSEEDSEEKPKK